MKKLSITLLTAAMLGMVACGPSAEEQAATQKASLDSMKKAMDDSLAIVQQQADEAARQMQDSLAMVAQMDSMKKAMEDSIASISAAADKKVKAATSKPKPKPVTPEEKKKEETKKATQGRG